MVVDAQRSRLGRWARERPARIAIGEFVALLVLVVVSVGVVGTWVNEPFGDTGCPAIVDFELARTPSRWSELVDGCAADSVLKDQALAERAIESSNQRDLLFIALYTTMLFYLCKRAGGWRQLGSTELVDIRPSTRRAEKRAVIVAYLAPIAGALDVLENVAMGKVARSLDEGFRSTWAEIAFGASVGKWVLIVPAVIVAFRAWLRLLRPVRPGAGPTPGAPEDAERPDGYRWLLPEGHETGGTGICLSGGGVRSATFNLGVLQSLDTPGGPLRTARWLASVSGGGYIATAYQAVAHDPAREKGEPLVPPAGSVEDHLRRHSTHLADGAGEWALALGHILLRVALGLGAVMTVIWVVGRPLGWAFREFLYEAPTGPATEAFKPTLGHLLAVAFPLGFALLLRAMNRFEVTAREAWEPDADARTAASDERDDRLRRLAIISAVAVAMVALVLPGLAAYSDRGAELATEQAARLLGIDDADKEIEPADGSSTSEAPHEEPSRRFFVLGAVGSLVAGVLSKRRFPVGSKAPRPAGKKSRFLTEKLGLGTLPELVTGPIVALTFLLAFANVVVDAWRTGPSAELRLPGPDLADWQVWAIIAGGALVAWIVVDVTSWSLHPFYRRRLWTAYAVERGAHGDAAELDWEQTDTQLSKWGTRKEGRYPELLLCCAVQVEGRRHAPPGRRAVPFVLSATAAGSPEAGYIPTTRLEAALGRRRRRDISLFGSMAISGAAFGSAMGRHSQGSLNAVFALTNARLGVWLPNPRRFAAGDPPPVDRRWHRRRHLGYWVREIFGRYDLDAPFVLVADGGHVDNLGLIELLRRRCQTILCFDASGSGTAPYALAEALVLAREELGVRIELDDPQADGPLLDLATTGADPLGRDQSVDSDAIGERLARRDVLTATIHYPPVNGTRQEPGRLIYGCSVVTPDVEWDVLAHAQRSVDFPNDGTGQQWFQSDTFAAYHALGRYVGTKVAERVEDT